MFPFGKKKEGGNVTHLNRMVWVGLAVAAIKAIQAYFGADILDDAEAQQFAEVLINAALIVSAIFAARAVKPAVVEAADAQGIKEVAKVKKEAGIKPADIEAAEPKVNLGVIKAAEEQGPKELAQAKGAE